MSKTIDGICYKDFYRYGKLKINSHIVFYNKQDNIHLTIYDDRFCDIWSDNLKIQQTIYTKYRSWVSEF